MKKPKNYKWQKNDGTGTMSRHLRSEHGLGAEGEEGSSGGGQDQLHGYASDMPGTSMPFVYNRDRMITEFGKFIIADELPFSFGESPNYEYFNRVALQPQYRRVPRNTLKRHTQQAYYAYRSYLMDMFRIYDGCVSLTSDTWTSTYGEPFVCVTVHWINDDWAMEFLKEDPSIKLLLNGSLMHVRCCALNLCVQEGLDELRTLLEPTRGVIRWIRAARSAKRIFKHKCDEYGLRKKVIALDTTTRWNSTYKLLHDAIAYRDILTDMYNESRATDGKFITNDHWSLAKIIHDVPETFNNATHIFSYVYEPNTHMVILECIKIICTIKQTSLANPDPSVKRLLENMKVKWCAYFTEFPPIYAIGAILDPGVKLEGLTNLLTFYYQQLDINFDVPYYVNNCKRILERLCEDFGAVIQPQPVGSSMGASRFGILGPVLKNQRPNGLGSSSTSSSSSSSSNIGIGEYLTYQFETEETFHIIHWWKNHSSKFPVLARIAKDILVIPASTIASESAFSAGRRVIDEKDLVFLLKALKCVY
ncbi:Zinc finger BED domain-containing protein RICESLEEPER 2, partial [Bienertia sinuspersici]